MKNFLFLLIVLCFSFSQNSIDLQFDGAFFPLNKDNSLLEKHDIEQIEEISGAFTFSASYNFKLNDYKLRTTLSYFSKQVALTKFIITNDMGTHYNGSTIYLKQTHIPLDISFIHSFNEYLHLGYGVSLNRMVRSYFNKQWLEEKVSGFENSITAYGVGMNGLFEFRYPMNDSWKFYLQTKFRWISHLLYSSNGNDTSEYNHYYLMSYLSLGFSYSL